ncbi:MAG: hypothetical protein CVT95_05835 [Bacteroidetes bacterium HGW-Bacteroidetes-12]|nr:MAG: hypothetical protein CVT95_05835 [Bacteroidetes bacterium HGW-Bacteroidetes-12]
MRLIIFIVLCNTFLISNGQDYFLSKKELRSDYKKYISITTKKHAGVYRYNTKKYFKNFTDSIRETITDSMSVYGFYKILSLTNAKLGCGHSSIELPDIWLKNEIFPPISLYSCQEKYYIWHDLTTDRLDIENKEVLAINKIPIDTIITEIEKYIQADGFIQISKKRYSEKLFPIYFAKYYARNKENTITLKDENENEHSITLQSQKFISLSETSQARYPISSNKIYASNEDDYFYLKINSFFIDTIEFKNKIDSIFQIIEKDKPQNLVLDLRGNTGGKIVNEYYLLSYLIEDEIETHIKREYKINSRKFKEYTSIPRVITPTNTFQFKKTYFIMDGSSFSASGEFLSIAKFHQIGLLVGEETGAANEGCNTGNYLVTLKKSGLKFNTPNFKHTFEKASSEKGRGLTPDYPVYFTKADIVNNVDVALNLIRKLILRNKNK